MNIQLPLSKASRALSLSVTFLYMLLGPVALAQGTIQSNVFRVSMEFSNYWAGEATGVVILGILRSDDEQLPISVDYATTDGSAKAGIDYVSTAGTLTFSPAEKLKSVTIPILNDGIKEATKTFSFGLSHPSAGATLGL